jgi:hypothetical protein
VSGFLLPEIISRDWLWLISTDERSARFLRGPIVKLRSQKKGRTLLLGLFRCSDAALGAITL